ncbi:DUF5050 domain-containing protein [Clostridium sp. JS66]|uniref:DUF5050 domain-containing protein n=1 Tax=Clostridium sp. JS66 TaxID=3064705 RepID=UPI00298DE246|nr:DUF5050 domain-containing protein [Clostridium sp. JS66]WPC41009.1 DUF5050 domain-containing protein [Clostridium sp. JS66]
MKRTKMLVMTAAIVLGLGTSVYAALPGNSIVVGNNVYDVSYFTNDTSGTHTAQINDQLANNLDRIYYVDSTGIAKDIFTNSTVTDSQIADKVGNTLTYYPGNGTTEKIVRDASGNFTTPATANGGYAITHVTYKSLAGGLYLFTCQVNQLSGVTGAAYFQVGNSTVTPLTDLVSYMGQLSGGSNGLIHIYASDGTTELANGYLNLVTNGSASGDVNLTINLQLTGNSTNLDDSTQGSKPYNITNNGFAAMDKDGKWIYYSNSADGNKLYRKSVTGTSDFLISNDSVKFINVVGDWVYYSNYNDGGRIYKVQKDGTQRQKVSNDMAAYINVVGDSIYYINHSDRDRIYVQDSQGKKLLINDKASYLSLADSYLFYVNAGDSNKLYSYYLKTNGTNSKALISTINTRFVNACNDYLVFYTGYNGILYRSTNAQGQIPVPMTVTTNVATKSSKTSAYKALTEKPTIICATDDNNIYYISNVDGKKIYKLDTTGNGYKVVDDSADYINIIGDSLYYMKASKVYVADKNGDGTQKGVAITKPKLDSKVVTINPIPTFTTDDITKFNFPETVSCIMSDGSQQTLVVSWNKTIPKPAKGIYTFKGTILGYGNAVTLSVALGSGAIDASNVTIVNNIGSKDTISIKGLTAGDVINVYNNVTDTKSLKTATADANGNVNMTGLNLSPDGGNVYISLTKAGRLEGDKISVQYQAEAPAGFAVNAADQNVTGLKPGKQYKVYVQDENSDGTTPALNGLQITGYADSNGNLNVPTMITKIDGNANLKQMLRVVASGTVDSAPSAPIEISRAVVPDYVAIDLNLGRITGTTTNMVFTYKDPSTATAADWNNPCQAGSTPISLTRSLLVGVKVLANGPALESKPVSYGLFPLPVITGIENGKTYTTKNDPATGASLFPTVTWNSNTTDPSTGSTLNYTATLTKDGVTLTAPTQSTLADIIKAAGDGNYVLKVTGTKTVSTMNPSSATNTTTIKFTVSSAVPQTVDISFIEKGGTNRWTDASQNAVTAVTSSDIPTLYQATPTWTNLAGTTVTTTLQRLPSIPASATMTTIDWSGAANVAFVQNSTIQQDGYYKLTVVSKSTENGATNMSTKIFRVDTTDVATLPTVSNITDGAVYNGTSKIATEGIKISDSLPNSTVATLMKDGYKTPYTSGKEITVNGNYQLILDTTNTINGAITHKQINFKVDGANTDPTQTPPQAPTGVTFTFNPDGTAQLGGVDTSEEYSVNNGQSWTPVTSSTTQLITSTSELNSLNNASTTSVQVRYKVNGSTPASNAKVINLNSSPSTPTFAFAFTNDYANHKLVGTLSGTGIENAQYSIDGGLTWKTLDTGNVLKSGDAELVNTTNGVWVRTKATGTTKASNIEKIAVSQASAPIVNSTVTSTATQTTVKLSSLQTGLEYRVKTANTTGNWTAFDVDKTASVLVTQAGSIEVRNQAVGTAAPGYSTTIAIQAAPGAAIDYNSEQITGVNTSMQWSADGNTWTPVTGTTLDLKANSLIPDYGSPAKDVYITYVPTGAAVGLTQHLVINPRQQDIVTTNIKASLNTSTNIVSISGLNASQVNAYDVLTSTDSGTTFSTSSIPITTTNAGGVGNIGITGTVNRIEIRLKATGTASASKYTAPITVTTASAQATGTITLGSIVDNDTVTVAGIQFKKAAANSGTNFLDASGLATAINNNVSTVTATVSGSTITITAKTAGADGNGITLSTSTSAVTLSGANLTGGQ